MSLVTPSTLRGLSSTIKLLSNQTDYDIQSDEWLRNTKSYNTNNRYSGYDYIFDSNKIKKQSLDVTASSLGVLSGVGIVTGGRNYQVNDELYLTTVNLVVEGSG